MRTEPDEIHGDSAPTSALLTVRERLRSTEMRQALVVAVALLVVLAAVAVPVAAWTLGGGGGGTAVGAATTETPTPTPTQTPTGTDGDATSLPNGSDGGGAHLSGAVAAQGTELGGAVAVRTVEARLLRADTDHERAAVVAEVTAETEELTSELRLRRERLEARAAAGELTPGEYRHRLRQLNAKAVTADRLATRSLAVAEELPESVREEHGIDLTRLRFLADRTDSLREELRSDLVAVEGERSTVDPPSWLAANATLNGTATGSVTLNGTTELNVSESLATDLEAARTNFTALELAIASANLTDEEELCAVSALDEAGSALSSALLAAEEGNETAASAGLATYETRAADAENCLD